MWLAILYILGAYIRKYEVFKKMKKKTLLIIGIGLLLFTWVWKIGMGMLTVKLVGYELGDGIFVSYTSPTILGTALILVLLFANMEVKNGMKKYVKFLASSAFGVYLIHTHPLVFEYIIKGRFTEIARLSVWEIPFTVLGIAVFIFIGGVLIDKIRIIIFKVCKVNLLAQKLENIGREFVQKCQEIMVDYKRGENEIK